MKSASERRPSSRASFRKPPEVKLPEGSEGRPSFGRKRRTPFLREEAARGEASRRTFRKKLLPSGTSGASFVKPPEVKLPEGRSERECCADQGKPTSFGGRLRPAEPHFRIEEGRPPSLHRRRIAARCSKNVVAYPLRLPELGVSSC